MNTATIEKCLNLLNANNLDDLRNLLNYEKQASILTAKKGNTKFLPAVKKYLDDKNLVENYPDYVSIQHTADGKQFICNGCSLIKWESHKPELDAFKQTDTNKSLPYPDWFSENYFLSSDDEIILKNLDKYVTFYKDKIILKDRNLRPVTFCNAYYDSKLLKKVFDVIGINSITEIKTLTRRDGIKVITADAEAFILGLRLANTGEDVRINEITKEFINKLNEVEK